MVFLFIVIIIICSGMLSVYFSKRHLNTARFFADNIIPGIQRINDLQQAAAQVDGSCRLLSKAPAREDLAQGNADLLEVLARMEGLTATITHEDKGIDIVTLNFLSQAIRTQAQLVFQLKAQRLTLVSEQQEITRGIHHGLMELLTLASDPVHRSFHGLLKRADILMQTLNRASDTPFNIRQLREEFAAFRRESGLLLSQTRDKQLHSHARALLDQMTAQLDRLLGISQESWAIHREIGGFIATLDDLSGRLIQVTGQYIQGVRDRFRKDAEKILKREEQNINLTNGGLVLSILILYLLHWKIIIRGFGNRLSMISRAMGQGAEAEGDALPLPLQGRDEISDMARSAEELLKKAKKLNTMATMDELTRVYNRRQFFQLAKIEAERAARKKEPAVILMLDIDLFKRINDTWGHDFGDRALREFAAACSRKIRTLDIFARYGGEEFILLMPDTDPDQGMTVARRLLHTVAALKIVTDSGSKVGLTVSVGMAEADLGTEGVEAPIKRADTALYEAKRLGRNRIERFKLPGPDARG